MLRYFIIYSVFFIPASLYPSDVTKSHQLGNNYTSYTSSERDKKTETIVDDISRLKVNLSSEGGPIIPDKPHTTLPLANLLELDSETGKNKIKSIAARKGVDLALFNDLPESEKTNSSNVATLSNINVSTLNKQSVQILTNSTSHDTAVEEGRKKPNISYKPQILSHEALANSNRASKVLANDDILPSKISLVTGRRSPDLIMPVIITVLVVPLFAALGYLALKRGQEAWKNRHYKRMDFLLDGMYND